MTRKIVGMITASTLLLATLPARAGGPWNGEIPADYPCYALPYEVQKLAKTTFGAEGEIVDIWNIHEIERTTTKLRCSATGLFAIGGEGALEFGISYKPETNVKWFLDVQRVK
jgi:hypothetical protein